MGELEDAWEEPSRSARPGSNDVTDPLQAGPCPDPPRANLLGTHSSSARPWARGSEGGRDLCGERGSSDEPRHGGTPFRLPIILSISFYS